MAGKQLRRRRDGRNPRHECYIPALTYDYGSRSDGQWKHLSRRLAYPYPARFRLCLRRDESMGIQDAILQVTASGCSSWRKG